MIEVLNNLINNPIDDFYNYDYINKLQNKNYQLYIKDKKQISIEEFKNFLIENNFEIMNEINSIKSEFLYDSVIHGINHNIRVLLYAFYLGKKLNLDEKAFRIIMDACKYHDVGRRNDLYDESHGQRSAMAVERIVDDKIYEDKENLDMLRAIINYHSIPDEHINQIINKYSIKDEKTFKTLSYLLKDADGLDRVRLSVGNKYFSDLNPRYLRFYDSLTLIQVTHIINTMHFEYIKSEKEKLKKSTF